MIAIPPAPLYEADGRAGEGASTLYSILPQGGRPLGVFFHPTGDGWHAITHETRSDVRTWDALGTPGALYSDLSATEIAPDGQGGSVVLGYENANSSFWHLAWLDAGGRLASDALLDYAPGAVLVQWGTGHVLVVTRARGRGPAGTTRTGTTDWFSTGVNAPAGSFLRGLLDGTLMLSDGNAWVAAFTEGSTSVSWPPSWLLDRPGTYLAVRPNARGYVTFEARSGRAPAAEIITPSGQSCGFLSPPAAAAASPSRTAIAWSLGEDGTFLIVETVGNSVYDYASAHSAVRWWPALLQ